MQSSDVILKVDNMRTVFQSRSGTLEAVSGVSLSVAKGETLEIVGESGSGKSVSALSIIKLLEGAGQVASGSILFNDLKLNEMTNEEI